MGFHREPRDFTNVLRTYALRTQQRTRPFDYTHIIRTNTTGMDVHGWMTQPRSSHGADETLDAPGSDPLVPCAWRCSRVLSLVALTAAQVEPPWSCGGPRSHASGGRVSCHPVDSTPHCEGRKGVTGSTSCEHTRVGSQARHGGFDGSGARTSSPGTDQRGRPHPLGNPGNGRSASPPCRTSRTLPLTQALDTRAAQTAGRTAGQSRQTWVARPALVAAAATCWSQRSPARSRGSSSSHPRTCSFQSFGREPRSVATS